MKIIKDYWHVYIFLIALVFYLEFFYSSLLVPKPSDIWESLVFLLTNFNTYENIFSSIIRVLGSVFIAIILGIAIGSAHYFSDSAGRFFQSLFFPMQYISSVIWSLIAVILFGLTPITAYFVIIIAILPNIFVAIKTGIRNINDNLETWAKTHTKSKWKLFRYIIFPQILPHLWIGVARAHAIAWKIVVTAEFFIAINGLGGMVSNYYHTINTEFLFATVLIILAIGFTMDKFFRFFLIKFTGVKL